MVNSARKSLHVLFSDDDTDDAMLFTQAADLLTFPVLLSFAEDGEQLMRSLTREVLPDLIFLDLNMPLKNGIECLKIIRKNKNLDWLPVIIYTTSQDPDEIEQCYQLGANLYVVKPTSFENIIKTLRKVLTMEWKPKLSLPVREDFVLSSQH